MVSKSFKSLLVAAFSVSCLFFSTRVIAQYRAEKTPQSDDPATGRTSEKKEEEKLNPSKIILEHVSDGHEFHFFTFNHKPVVLPLPVILYSPANGWFVSMSSVFEHGEKVVNGYRLLGEEFVKEHHLDLNNYQDIKGKKIYIGKIYAVDAAGMPDTSVKVYDLSLSRNAIQVLISVLLLIWLMNGVAGKYSKGHGVRTAPSGFQNAVEPVITFVRDEVGKSNLGSNY
jgi:F-type H+-transporting ATPase subunit a